MILTKFFFNFTHNTVMAVNKPADWFETCDITFKTNVLENVHPKTKALILEAYSDFRTFFTASTAYADLTSDTPTLIKFASQLSVFLKRSGVSPEHATQDTITLVKFIAQAIPYNCIINVAWKTANNLIETYRCVCTYNNQKQMTLQIEGKTGDDEDAYTFDPMLDSWSFISCS